MKKKLLIASLSVLTAILGFSNTAGAANRPNTPECVDVNGRSDVDACLIQYIEPLLVEMIEMRNRLMKLQGKNPTEDPWEFDFNSPACDQNSPYYDEKFCVLQIPGKLAQEKYILREEIRKLEAAESIKRQKTKLASAQTTIRKMVEENKKLTEKLANAEKKNEGLAEANISLAKELEKWNKIAGDQENRANTFRAGFILSTIIAGLFAVACIILLIKYKP